MEAGRIDLGLLCAHHSSCPLEVLPVRGFIYGPEMPQARDSQAWLPCVQHSSGLADARGGSDMGL